MTGDGEHMSDLEGLRDEPQPPPPLEDDRTAMMLGLVPDKRTPEERLWDAVRTNGESLRYRYEPPDAPAQDEKP